MSTVRTAVKEAMRLLKAVAPGDDPTVDELDIGLDAAQALTLEIHEGRGPLLNIDVTSDLTPGENQRLRVQAGASVDVTLPNSISIFGAYDPYDYGFEPSSIWDPPVGSTAPADGIFWRPPTDGARIEIVGATQALYFYRADLNQWSPALGLTLDTELPFSSHLQGAFAAILGERLADVLANLPEPTKAQLARVAHAREAMFTRPGARRAPVRGQYL